MQRSRRRILGVPWPDLALAALLTIAAIATTALDQRVLHPITEIVAVVLSGSVALRTRAPLTMAGIAAVACVAFGQLPGASTPLWSFVTVLVLAFSVTAHLIGIRAIVAIAFLLAGTFLVQAHTDPDVIEVLLTPIILVGAPGLAGWLLARARRQAERLRTLTVQLDAEREQHALLAAEAERARIARDLHDILAHTLSSIAVQAGAAQQLLASSDPAREPVENIMTATHDALGEVRSLLAVIRADPQEANSGMIAQACAELHEPDGGLRSVFELVAASGAELEIVGTPIPIQEGIAVSLLRIVQESLTNARRHAPGAPVRVTIDYGASYFEVEIVNAEGTSASPTTGYGLIGMTERAAAHSGSLQAGFEPGRGWVVRARLPYTTSAATDAALTR